MAGLLLTDVAYRPTADPPALAAAMLTHGFVVVSALPVAVATVELPPLIAAV